MDHRGISAVATAVTLVLERAWEPGRVPGVVPRFATYRSRDFADPMTCGLSVFVRRVSVVATPLRLPPPDALGGVALAATLVLTAWAESAHLELALLGWGACALADHPVLDAALLNAAVPGVCSPDETVLVQAAEPDPSLHDLWQTLPCSMQLSLSYVVADLRLTIS